MSISRQSQNAAAKNDVFRDSIIRYVAFTSDVGEAFKPFITRRLYLGSYAVVSLYGLLDSTDKGRRAYIHAAAAARQLPTVPAVATPSIGAPHTTLPSSCGFPLASLSAAATMRHSAASAAATCAACLPPPAAYHATASSISERQSLAVPVAAAVLDTALWHAAASLVIPAVAINRTVWGTRMLLNRAPAALTRTLHPCLLQLTPSAAGLALIPLAVHHIDEAVTGWMDAHLRPQLPKASRSSSSS